MVVNRTEAQIEQDHQIKLLIKEVEDLKVRVERLSTYEHFINLLIEKESDRKKLRKALIEKSLGAIAALAVTTAIMMTFEGIKQWLRANIK